MTQKTKIKLFYIFTLGIGYLYAKKKAQQQAQHYNTEIKTTNDVGFDINKLIDLLGGIANIQEVDATISSVKIKLEDVDLADLDRIKALGAKGTLKNLNQLTILFGDNSQAIANALKAKMH